MREFGTKWLKEMRAVGGTIFQRGGMARRCRYQRSVAVSERLAVVRPMVSHAVAPIATGALRAIAFQKRAKRGKGLRLAVKAVNLSTTEDFRYSIIAVSGQSKSKRILPTSFTGHKGVLLIDSVVTEMGWLF